MNEWRSFQEVLSTRQRADFVGRDYEIEMFKWNLGRSASNPARYFAAIISGQGGIGIFGLRRRFEDIAK